MQNDRVPASTERSLALRSPLPMIFHGCRECRTFSGLLRFMPPAGCVKPAVFVCEWCADNDARWRYSYWCCTDA